MTTIELLAAVRQMKESGDLRKMAADQLFRAGATEILAQFAVAVLEQRSVGVLTLVTQGVRYPAFESADCVFNLPDGEHELFSLPPAPATIETEQRAAQAATAVVQWLYEGMDGATVKLMAINVESIILSVMRGEE